MQKNDEKLNLSLHYCTYANLHVDLLMKIISSSNNLCVQHYIYFNHYKEIIKLDSFVKNNQGWIKQGDYSKTICKVFLVINETCRVYVNSIFTTSGPILEFSMCIFQNFLYFVLLTANHVQLNFEQLWI